MWTEMLLASASASHLLAFGDAKPRLRNGLAEETLLFQPFVATVLISQFSSEENVPGLKY